MNVLALKVVTRKIRVHIPAGVGRALALCLLLLYPQALFSLPVRAASSPSRDADNLVAFLPLVVNNVGPDWADCSRIGWGTLLVTSATDADATAANVLIYANDQLGVKGMAGTGAPSEEVRDEWYSRLPGWTRSFMRGTYVQLETVHQAATVFDMEDMYECLTYGPEYEHAAGEEALEPRTWVPRAQALAGSAGKCLIYGPAVRDYELMAQMEGLLDPSAIVGDVAPHVDVWMIQLAKYQNWVDLGHDDVGHPYTLIDFTAWIAGWVSWIKDANPEAEVWTQLGIGRWDALAKTCLPPQPPEYLLEYREALASAGVDGVWVMPSQPCMPCPPDPPAGFPCSTDPQDNEYYALSLAAFQQAIDMTCTP